MSRTYSNLKFHAIVCVQDGGPLIPVRLRSRVQRYIMGVLKRRNVKLLKIGGTGDHVHLLMGLKTTHSPAGILMTVKEATELWLSQVIGPTFAWEPGYDIYSVSESKVRDVTKFIEDQEKRHRSMSLREERQRLWNLHGIEPFAGSRVYACLRYHFVFSTRERRWLIGPHLQSALYSHIGEILHQEGDRLLEIGGIPDHVHATNDQRGFLALGGRERGAGFLVWLARWLWWLYGQ